MTGRSVWPPTKEDLERLYLVEKLSAAKIADAYGLTRKYKTPKVAESTILYHLKKNGIQRRDCAEHIRKVTAEMVDDWVARYLAGQSLKKIAGNDASPVTVWNQLRARGVALRDKVEAQILAVTKHERKPFKGDRNERAYMMGLRYGDLNAVKHGRAIRVRVSTTHPAMADLFESLFSPYGYIHRYPRAAKLVGYEWTLECDLDSSFQFLLAKVTFEELRHLSTEETLAFLAGLFDAEGTIYLHNKRGRYNPEVAFTNTERPLLEYVVDYLRMLGLHCDLDWRKQDEDRHGIFGISESGRATIWRFNEVQRILRQLPIKHPEKKSKRVIVQEMSYRGSKAENLKAARDWDRLTEEIKAATKAFVELARKSIVVKGPAQGI